MSKIRRFITALLLIVLIVIIAIPPTLVLSVRGAIPQSYPQVDGEIHLAGLDGRVDVYRDKMGIPHIYATTLHDLFYAQGYVHAQDRFWQMDFWRHIGSARLSEMFGKGQVSTDSFLRTLGWRQIAEQEYAELPEESRAILQSYSAGVNAYLADHSGAALSLEYVILKALTPGYSPEAWTPIHSLTWAKAMAWDLRGNMGAEIERAVLMKTLTAEQVDELFPTYPDDHPVIVPEIGDFSTTAALTPASGKAADASLALDTVDFAELAVRFNALEDVLGKAGAGIGSNSWAVSGARSVTGMPLLANDPHLGIQMPSIWYQIGLHCQPRTDACPFEVGGFSFAGVPGVVIGHNDRIAWAFTNTGPDVMDLFVLKVNPENPNQYEYNGAWVDFEVRTETILVAGGDAVEQIVRVSRFGPVISDDYGPLKDKIEPDSTATPFKDKAGIELPETYAVALRWTALEPGSVFEAIWGFNKAQNWEEFRAASQNFVVPAQNLLYADVDGNIGYQMPGNIPVRRNGDGRLPVPGWTDEYEWTGYLPFEEHPYVFNPPSGYIVTANNQVPPRDYPYLIGTDWDYGYRAQRIVDMIEQAPGQIDIAYFQKMQGDSKSLNAEIMVPLLLQVPLDADLAAIREKYLANWDYQETIESPSAALFEAFWWDLVAATFMDENIPEDYQPSGGSRTYEVMRNLVQQPNSPWWDDKSTADVVETRDDIFARAFAEAVKCQACTEKFGADIANWKWGELHSSTFRNATLGKSGVSLIENLFNRGEFPTAGGESIVNATGWDIYDSFEVNWLPSMRMIVDLSDLNNSVTVHTTGQSGHAYASHYIDMADLWRNIQYYPMWWNADSVRADAEAHLQLLP